MLHLHRVLMRYICTSSVTAAWIHTWRILKFRRSYFNHWLIRTYADRCKTQNQVQHLLPTMLTAIFYFTEKWTRLKLSILLAICVFIYLFIYSLYDETSRSSDHLVWIVEGLTCEWRTRYQLKRWWHILIRYPVIRPAEYNKTREDIQDWRLDRLETNNSRTQV